ncbi:MULTISPECIES: nucleotide exchange factor GrpE [Rhizobium/Agrobacterium group]|uniref:Protein GrpE n=2 Tax=Neorhizobium TaxID=1525371 RepID=A0ABV0LX21_9HYPH|nr:MULTISPECIES: nucleotide exchange factor GrpE [Rhizobium/Agrobacterium group]KGD86492.1 molecular chaperone GrpE [Rhizobium sp. YS-1r]MCC2608245.1 nucleotide exchange factor GrpE [Neorhizobium petrolearium]WGI68530.1 nucleotide exchange factor GrpE [Neorhizobium petrolearium]
MTDETKKNGPDTTAAENTTEAVASALEDAANQNAAEAPAPDAGQTTDPLGVLKAENAELRDRFLRLAAEMDNLRRRTERDVKDAKSYSVAGFARDMLAVSDNLRRALDAVPTEMRAGADATLTTLLEGVEMTERSMLSALERHGVKRIEAEGQKFDPHFHQAMFEIPDTTVPNNTVVQVVQAGFTIGERVLRPAMVGVAKGGPKPEASAAEPAGENKA